MNLAQRIATIISWAAHPVVTLPLFAVYALFRNEPREKAIQLSAMVVGVVFLPLILKTLYGARRGRYTNLDVSNREQRKKWYWLPNLLLLSLTVYFFLTPQRADLRYAFLFAWLLMQTSQLVNFRLKTSLHVGFHAYFVCLLYNLLPQWGIFALFTIPFMAWSRVTLGRHSLAEVSCGALLGLLAGGTFLWVVG
jgi:membrane-associated phospholipid phosphatase